MKSKKQEQQQAETEQTGTVALPQPILDKVPVLMERIKKELDQEDILYKLIEQVQFAPLQDSSETSLEMPTMVFVVNEGEVRPYPAYQLNDREIVIDFGARYENLLKKIYGDNAKEDPRRGMLRKKFFVGVDAHKLILPREFFAHPGIKDSIETLPKFIHLRVFKMYMGEPFVRNFFTNDIVNKKEKWELLVEQNIAERYDMDEQQDTGYIEAKDSNGNILINNKGEQLYEHTTKLIHWEYRIKAEFCVSAEKPVYDINSFDFVKSEFFEQEFSKMIVVGIRALYEEFDRKGTSIGMYMLGEAIVFLLAFALLLYFMPNIISTSKKANGVLLPVLSFALNWSTQLLHFLGI